jgi:hypothetical protein
MQFDEPVGRETAAGLFFALHELVHALGTSIVTQRTDFLLP